MTTIRRALFRSANYWRGISVADENKDVPSGALLTEAGTPILTEDGQYIMIES